MITSENPAPDTPMTPNSQIGEIVSRLETLLKEEQACLDTGKMDSLEAFANRKMQLLVQLNRTTTASAVHHEHRENLSRIRDLLKTNMRKLDFRIRAIGEIAETIESAFRESDSDGTYDVAGQGRWDRA